MKRQRRTEYIRTEGGELVREDSISETNGANRNGPHSESESSSSHINDYQGANGNRHQNEQEKPYNPGRDRHVSTKGEEYRTPQRPAISRYGGPRGAFDEAPDHPKTAIPK